MSDGVPPLPPGAVTRLRLRVLSLNIAIGGEAVDLGQVVAAIRASGADVVA